MEKYVKLSFVMERRVEMRKDCPHFESCSAPICPFETGLNFYWQPHEDICRNKEFQNHIVIRNQKAIKKLHSSSKTYFTTEMLSLNLKIREGFKGIENEDFTYEDERRWIKREKEYRKRLLLEIKKRARKILKEVKNG